MQLDDKLAESEGGEGAAPIPVSETMANIVYWFIWLFFTPIILGVLELEGALGPVQELLDRVLEALPNLFLAIAIGGVGWFVARIVRGIVTSFLMAIGVDRFGEQLGLPTSGAAAEGEESDSASFTLSGAIGHLTFALILIPTAIAALNELAIDSIADPAIAMLEQVLTFLPQVAIAIGVLVAFYLLGRLIGNFVTGFLTGIGFNNISSGLGITICQPCRLARVVKRQRPKPARLAQMSRGQSVKRLQR